MGILLGTDMDVFTGNSLSVILSKTFAIEPIIGFGVIEILLPILFLVIVAGIVLFIVKKRKRK